MDTRIQILAIAVSLMVILLVVWLIRGRKLREEYSIVWLLGSLVLLVFSIWRGLLDIIARLVGVYYAPAVLLLVTIFFGALAFLHFSVVISSQAEQQKNMAQEIALLKEKVRRLTEGANSSG
jgi:hypothetical protein